jgi:hypothetical protein
MPNLNKAVPGDVVAQLAKANGWHQTANEAVPGSNPAPLTASWTGPGNMAVYYKINLRVGGVPAWVEKKEFL